VASKTNRGQPLILASMKNAAWLIACPILLVLGVVSLFQGFGGSTRFNSQDHLRHHAPNSGMTM
jgi:hypothetical protein